MLGTALIFLAHAGMFSFSAKIGESLGISVTKIGYIFMSGGVLTIIGPLMAGFIGQRFGSLIPCLILMVILSITGIIIPNKSTHIFLYGNASFRNGPNGVNPIFPWSNSET